MALKYRYEALASAKMYGLRYTHAFYFKVLALTKACLVDAQQAIAPSATPRGCVGEVRRSKGCRGSAAKANDASENEGQLQFV
jgi:hypothetical protein